MSSGTLLIVLLVGVPLLMMLMHRGGAGGMMGGCCGGHAHGHGDGSRKDPTLDDERSREVATTGTGSQQATEPPAPARS